MDSRIMSVMLIVIAFSLVLYGINRYIFRKLIKHEFHSRTTFWVMLLTPILYAVSYGLNGRYPSVILDHIVFVCGFWFITILYLVLFAISDDFVRVLIRVEINKRFIEKIRAVKAFDFAITYRYKLFLGIIMPSMMIYAYSNATSPQVTYKEILLGETPSQELTIVFMSDIHIGATKTNSFMENIVETVNTLEPDVIFLGGDILDGDVEAARRKGLVNYLDSLKSRYGIWGITGNHEYIGGVSNSLSVMTAAKKLTMLQDETICIDSLFYVIGRKDKMVTRRGETRNSINELMPNNSKHLPIILLDHQPFELEIAEDAGVDLQLSGHTHHGQIFPVNYITNAIYEKSWGYLKKGVTHYYISCGVGTWGPVARVGSYSEIVQIHLKW